MGQNFLSILQILQENAKLLKVHFSVKSYCSKTKLFFGNFDGFNSYLTFVFTEKRNQKRMRKLHYSSEIVFTEKWDNLITWNLKLLIHNVECHQKKSPSNQLYSIFFSKMLLSRNFCQKSVTVNFRNFHTVSFKVWKFQNYPVTQFLREINFRRYRSSKTAILTFLEALNSYLMFIFSFFEGWSITYMAACNSTKYLLFNVKPKTSIY